MGVMRLVQCGTGGTTPVDGVVCVLRRTWLAGLSIDHAPGGNPPHTTQAGASLNTGALSFKNSYAMCKGFGGMPEG